MIETIKIDAVNYRVEETNDTIVVDGKECGAEVNYNTALIRVGNVIGEGKKAKTLMHEVFHALLFERGLDEASEDETLVNELASGTINLIRENPALVEYILGV